jgi:NAD(P)-dependent dehydrogenase (short-subunit alcohol dehydrogenase family)
MDLGLKGKAVLITGASKGIGAAAAEAFAEEGAVSRMTTSLHFRGMGAGGPYVQAARDLHSANAAKRFALNVCRSVRCRS